MLLFIELIRRLLSRSIIKVALHFTDRIFNRLKGVSVACTAAAHFQGIANTGAA